MFEDVAFYWKSFAVTFVAVFLAELGDKTQLATLGLAAAGGSRLTIFLAASSALVLTTLLAVLVGSWLQGRFDPRIVQRLAAALFLVIGGWMLWASFAAVDGGGPTPESGAAAGPSEG